MKNNDKVLEILNAFVSDKKVPFTQQNDWDNKNKNTVVFGRHYENQKGCEKWAKIGPFSYEDAFAERGFPQGGEKFKLSFISSELFNKKFTLGEFEVHIQHSEKIEFEDYKKKEYSNSGYKRVYHHTANEWIIFVKYHGVYLELGKYRTMLYVQANHCLPTCTNWWDKPTVDKPYMLDEAKIELNYDVYEKLEELLTSIDISKLKLEKSEVPLQEWYYHKSKKGEDLNSLSLRDRDYEYLIKREIKDGIYKPEKHTIDRLLFSNLDFDARNRKESPISINFDKKILNKLGVHTIQLRSDSHYDVRCFDLKGISIKAPQKVIENYAFEKYCKDEKMVEEIRTKQEKEKERAKNIKINNKFTLMQHGKVIMSEKDKEDIIDYLEDFIPSDKSPSSTSNNSVNFEEEIIKCVSPIFKDFNINKLYIAYWGRYFKYELAGEDCDITYECESLNKLIIKDDIWEEISELYEESLYPALDKKLVTNNFGWPERGGTILGVERVRGKLKVFTEDYDFE